MGAVVAAWPAASLVGSYELLLWLVRTAADGALVQEEGLDQATVPTAEADAMSESVGQDLDVGVVAPSREMTEQEMNDAAVAAYRESLKGRSRCPNTSWRRCSKASHRWARSRMAEARETSEAPDNQDDEQPVYRQQRAGRSVRPDPAVREAVSTR